MISSFISNIIGHLFKMVGLRDKQKLEAKRKTAEERKVLEKERLDAIEKHIVCVVSIKNFSSWDEYTKYGKSGFDIEKYDEKVSNLRAGLEALIVDVNKPELGYSDEIRETSIGLKRAFFLATRIWHESVLGQEYPGEKEKAASEFRASKETANFLTEKLNRRRDDLARNYYAKT